MKNKSKIGGWKDLILLILLIITLISTEDVMAGMLIMPNSITVAITNLSLEEKNNCTIMVDLYGNPGYKSYINEHVINKMNISFKDYSKGVLPNEWDSSWKDESLKAGALAVKNFAWYTRNVNNKWNSLFNFDITDTTCDQVYNSSKTTLRTNQSVDSTFDYYAQENSMALKLICLNHQTNN